MSKASSRGTAYTNEQIKERLQTGYFKVPQSLWDYIPEGSHICFFKRGPGADNERFRPGGFVKSHVTSGENRKSIIVETNSRRDPGDPTYITFPLHLDQTDHIWKKYSRDAFIEIHLAFDTLAVEKTHIKALSDRARSLEERLRSLEDRLGVFEKRGALKR